jgi:hypothetical protein
MAPPSRPLIAIAMDGSRKVFRNVREAEQETSVPRASIVRAAQGLTRRGEWLWKFQDDEREPKLAGQHVPILTEVDRELAREFVHALIGADGGVITEMRLSDGYINATLIAQSSGKLFSDWFRNQSTTEYIEALSQDLDLMPADLVQTCRTGSGSRFSWVHPRVATQMAMWISTEFTVRVSRWIEEAKQMSSRISTEYNDDLSTLKADKKKQYEAVVRDNLAWASHAKLEVECEQGFVDIVSGVEIVEIKRLNNYKAAIGQVISYGTCFPGKRKRIHLFAVEESNAVVHETLGKARKVCNQIGVEVTFERFTPNDYDTHKIC